MTHMMNVMEGSVGMVRAILHGVTMMALVLCTPALAQSTTTFAVPQAILPR